MGEIKMKKIHVRLTGLLPSDVCEQEDFMETLKEEIERQLTKEKILAKVWVKEIIIGKEVKRK